MSDNIYTEYQKILFFSFAHDTSKNKADKQKMESIMVGDTMYLKHPTNKEYNTQTSLKTLYGTS